MTGEVRHGQGQFIWDDGYAYEGHWDVDKMQGDGIYGYVLENKPKVYNKREYSSIIETYKGKFKANRFNGKGVLI